VELLVVELLVDVLFVVVLFEVFPDFDLVTFSPHPSPKSATTSKTIMLLMSISNPGRSSFIGG